MFTNLDVIKSYLITEIFTLGALSCARRKAGHAAALVSFLVSDQCTCHINAQHPHCVRPISVHMGVLSKNELG